MLPSTDKTLAPEKAKIDRLVLPPSSPIKPFLPEHVEVRGLERPGILAVLLLVVLALMGGTAWLIHRDLSGSAATEALQIHTYQVIDELTKLVSGLEDAEAGARGFSINGDDKFLDPYRAVAREYEVHLTNLRHLTADNPRQQVRLAALTPLITSEFANLREFVAGQDQASVADAGKGVSARAGRTAMDDIRALVRQARSEEERLLQERIVANAAQTRRMTYSIWLGKALSGLVLLGMFLLVQRELAKRHRAESALRRHQSHLTEMVAARTRELEHTNRQLSTEAAERQRSVEVLREHAALLDAAHDAIMMRHLDGTIVFWNDGAHKMYGYAENEALGKSSHELLQTLFPQPREQIEHGLRNEGRWEGELIHTTRTGIRLVVSSRWVLAPGKDGRLGDVMEINNNITPRKETEEALRESEKRFRGTFENAAVGFAHVDADGRWVRLNDQICRITGYDRAELLRKTIRDITHPEDLAADMLQVQRLLAGHAESYVREKRYIRKDGSIVWVNLTVSCVRKESGSVDYFIGVVEDISERKAQQLALQRSEARLRRVFESSPVGMMRWDLDRRLIVDANDEFSRMTGYSRDDVLAGRVTFLTLTAGEWSERNEEGSRAIREQGFVFPLEREYARHDGSRVAVIVAAVRFDDSPSEGMSFLIDRSERKRAEEALRTSEIRYRRLFEAAHDGVLLVHPETRRIIDANPFMTRLLGRSREQLLAQGLVEAGLIKDEATSREFFGRLQAEDQVRFDHLPLEGRDGQKHDVEMIANRYQEDGHSIIQCNIRDITARKQAEAAARQNAVLFTTLIEQAPMGVYVVDAQFRLQQVNSRAQPTFGNVKPLIGRDFDEVMAILWGPDVGQKCAAIFRHTLATGERYISPPFIEKRQDLGEEQSYEWETQRITLPDGEHGVVCYFHEVTKRVQAEVLLNEAKEAAEAANRAKDRFLAVLSHELRTPLTPVLLLVEELERQFHSQPAVQENLAMIKASIEHERRLIDDLLDISRIASGKLLVELTPVDANLAVRRSCENFQPQMRDLGVRLESSFDPAMGNISADSVRLEQVLGNVLRNALKFTLKGGVITVTTARLTADRCEIRVKDNGMGIAPDVLSAIFQAFEQGGSNITRRFGGLGLGLAICQAIMEAHNGSIRAESAGPGQGATFIIEFPCAVATTAPLALSAVVPGAAPPDAAAPNCIRVLLVEDHSATAFALERLLRPAGIAVTHAHDVGTALAVASHNTFDVLVSDLGLPDGTGYELMERLRVACDMPGIAMSGYGQPEDLLRAQAAGFREHLVKPVQSAQLLAAIRRVVRNHQS